MMDSGVMAARQLRDITECPICMSSFTDPRMLPCIHTFCFECLRDTAEASHMKPGDTMPCPMCRKEFPVPADGVNGLQKNFFMESLIEYRATLRTGSVAVICDICTANQEYKSGVIPKATMRCIECQDNYCDCCLKVHQFQRACRNHQVVKIGSESASGMKRQLAVKYCTKHTHKPLDYYCSECKKIVCVSCFVESHKLHDCKDITSAEEEFRQAIDRKAWKMSAFVNEMLFMRSDAENRKADFLRDITEKENDIHRRNQELKSLIDEHTKLLLDELSVVKSNRIKEMDKEIEEIERCCTILGSFETYCIELRSQGSASDICSSVGELILRADELERDHEAFIGRPHQSIEVSFKTTDLTAILWKMNANVVGKIKETTTRFENHAVLLGMNDGRNTIKDVVRVNLHRRTDNSTLVRLPHGMRKFHMTATMYCNTIYVTGVGRSFDEIWKFSHSSGWKICGHLVQGRGKHSAAFIDEVLYICGGILNSDESVLDTVEAYNAITNECNTVGKLVRGVYISGNCVRYQWSLYIFGGEDDDDNKVSHVQVYDTKQNACTLLLNPLPRGYLLLRAVLWETSVILLAHDTCFIYNLETETWLERKQFKTGVVRFGLVLEKERIFVLGGGVVQDDEDDDEDDEDDETTWNCTDDIRYTFVRNIVEDKPMKWKIYGKLSKPALVNACVTMACPVSSGLLSNFKDLR